MNAAVVGLVCLGIFLIAYRVYGKWLANRLFEVDSVSENGI